MKYNWFIIFSIILAIEVYGNFIRKLKIEENPQELPIGEDPPKPPSGDDDPPGPPPSGDEGNNYDYSNYKATSMNTDLNMKILSSKNIDESVVYINDTGIKIDKSELKKESGDSSNIENSEFYGVNAAVLVQGGEVTISDSTIETNAKGANSVCATNKGKVTISMSTITSNAESSARGLHATYGGEITALKCNILSVGGSCANLATDRGEGIVTCTDCILSTSGAGSPLIYSTGQITVSRTTGTSTGAQMVVVEGKNTATVKDSSILECNGLGNRNNVDDCGVFLYQSMSGDAEDGISTFICQDSSLTILSDSSVYSTAPMFFITNTKANINLENCTLSYGSKIFLNSSGTSEWGGENNGGNVTVTLNNQDIEGDIVVDGISTLELKMTNSKFTGKINTEKKASKLSINLDASSSITLTGDSYYTSLTNGDKSGSNIKKGSYKFEEYGSNSSGGSWIKISMLLISFILF